MMIKLAQRVQTVKPSPTLTIVNRANELRAAGRDVVGLGAGEPDFDTPEHIKEKAIQAIRDGKTKYTAIDGTPDLKQAIISKFKRENNLDYQPQQILVSCGGKQSFYNLAQALLNPGDEVIIPSPYWVSYPDMVLLAGALPVYIHAKVQQRFKISPAQLAAAITNKTKLVVLNSPSNPSGMAYNAEELLALGKVLREYPRIMIATDDMYEHIRWSAEPFVNILSVCPELYDRTIVINGVSKAYSMTGWRIGYAGGPTEVIKAMKKVQSQSTSNPASMSQAAAVAALEGPQDFIQEMVRIFKERHDYVIERLNAIDGVECLETDGTFYCFPNFSAAMQSIPGVKTDVEFAEHLINQSEVALVPGSAFGMPDYARISIATSQDNLVKGLDRITKALAN
ncbi:aspartate aminotransferase [Achromatium sp. WMS3]|nr:aspartate aminotransferase [Achromatium sp. WMS3]